MSKNIVTTPIGTAYLPFLFAEDPQYGNYKVAVRVDKKTAEIFKAKLLDLFKNEEFKTKNIQIPIAADEKHEGMYLIKTSSKFLPMVYDTKKNKITPPTNVGGGSEVRVVAEAYKYEVQKKEGIKLRLKQVQVYKLAEGSGGPCLFDEIEDGYVTDTQTSHVDDGAEVSALDL